MNAFTRRAFLKSGALLAAASFPGRLSAASLLQDPQPIDNVKSIVNAALESARSAGAQYADVHCCIRRVDDNNGQLFTTATGLSVRVLINGYWGFAASTDITNLDNAARTGREAVGQAKIVGRGKSGPVELAAIPKVANGSWRMPVEVDPFTVSFEEKSDFFHGMCDYIARLGQGITPLGALYFIKEERFFASTDGAYTAQTIYQSAGSLSVGVPVLWSTETGGSKKADFLSPAGAGWEYIRKAPFQEKAAELIEHALRSRRKKPVDVGRYDIVFDSLAMAQILGSTIGAATELDRAFGYESNDVGTSYITDPIEMIGTLKMGSPLLNVSINRSLPGGAATVKWDEDGSEPRETVLIRNGVLIDYQTSRESASWVADYYDRNGMSVQSNGCAGQYTPLRMISQLRPNMSLMSNAENVSFDDMIKSTKKGLAVIGGYFGVDQQALNGAGAGEHVYEIVNGKLGTAVSNAQYLLRAPEFWKNLVALGGRNTVRHYGVESWRNGTQFHTVSAVPAKVTGVAVTDITRKA